MMLLRMNAARAALRSSQGRSTTWKLPLATLTIAMAIASVGRADPVDFEKQIRPMFAENCYKCHAGDKHKGGLRLDTAEMILKGGKDAPNAVIVPKDPTKSDLYRRITVAKDDDDRMPPKGEMLPKDKCDLVKQWITEGASFGAWKEDSAAVIAAALGGGAGAATEPSGPKEVPLPQVAPGNPQAIDQVQQTGALCMKLAQDTNLLDVEYQLGGDKITDAQLAGLAPLASQIYWLNLANTKITDNGLAAVEPLANLRRLHLERTAITDSGVAHLKGLVNLEYLNLYGTQVSDAGLQQLAGLKNLKELYLWQSKATAGGADALKKQLPTLTINIGWIEPAPPAPPAPPAAAPAPAAAPTAAPPAAAPPAAAPPAPAAPKPPAPAPAAPPAPAPAATAAAAPPAPAPPAPPVPATAPAK